MAANKVIFYRAQGRVHEKYSSPDIKLPFTSIVSISSFFFFYLEPNAQRYGHFNMRKVFAIIHFLRIKIPITKAPNKKLIRIHTMDVGYDQS